MKSNWYWRFFYLAVAGTTWSSLLKCVVCLFFNAFVVFHPILPPRAWQLQRHGTHSHQGFSVVYCVLFLFMCRDLNTWFLPWMQLDTKFRRDSHFVHISVYLFQIYVDRNWKDKYEWWLLPNDAKCWVSHRHSTGQDILAMSLQTTRTSIH